MQTEPRGLCSRKLSRDSSLQEGATNLHLVLDPGTNGIGLGSKRAPQALIRMLESQLLLQGLIPDRHQLLHLSEPKER